MTIAYPEVGLFCELDESLVLELVVENQHIFSSLISDIHAQMNGGDGKFVLAKDNKPLELRKSAELITQIIPFEINQRELITKLYGELKNISVNENHYERTQQLMTDISAYLYAVTEELENDITVGQPQDISGLLKAFDVRFAESGMSLPEQILEYMIAVNDFKSERIFFFVNLRSYLTDAQAQLLYKNILLKKMTAVCIENTAHPRLSTSSTIIIDQDMCVI